MQLGNNPTALSSDSMEFKEVSHHLTKTNIQHRKGFQVSLTFSLADQREKKVVGFKMWPLIDLLEHFKPIKVA